MKKEEVALKALDGTSLHVYKWLPDAATKIKGVFQIAHGMSEHAKRFEEFAEFLVQHDWAVIAGDHRGHGKTASRPEDKGVLTKKNGWQTVVEDLHLISNTIKQDFPNQPHVFLGHSMGSFLVRDFLIQFGEELSGAILCATGGGAMSWLETSIGRLIAFKLKLLFGWRAPSKLLTALVFGTFNLRFRPARTPFDWLSRDPLEVDKFLKDPDCGFVCSCGFYSNLFKGVYKVNSKKAFTRLPKRLPVLFIAGDSDPVGKFGKSVVWVEKKFKKAGMESVASIFYKDARHELIKEINRQEVFNDILSWLNNLAIPGHEATLPT